MCTEGGGAVGWVDGIRVVHKTLQVELKTMARVFSKRVYSKKCNVTYVHQNMSSSLQISRAADKNETQSADMRRFELCVALRGEMTCKTHPPL